MRKKKKDRICNFLKEEGQRIWVCDERGVKEVRLKLFAWWNSREVLLNVGVSLNLLLGFP